MICCEMNSEVKINERRFTHTDSNFDVKRSREGNALQPPTSAVPRFMGRLTSFMNLEILSKKEPIESQIKTQDNSTKASISTLSVQRLGNNPFEHDKNKPNNGNFHILDLSPTSTNTNSSFFNKLKQADVGFRSTHLLHLPEAFPLPVVSNQRQKLKINTKKVVESPKVIINYMKIALNSDIQKPLSLNTKDFLADVRKGRLNVSSILKPRTHQTDRSPSANKVPLSSKKVKFCRNMIVIQFPSERR